MMRSYNRFHKNIVMVGLWAIRVATRRKSSRVYTYGVRFLRLLSP